MTDITIDLTSEDIESIQLQNHEAFDWTISLGGLHVQVTDTQMLALVDAVKRWEQL